MAIIAWGVFAAVASAKVVVSPLNHNSYAPYELGARLYWADLNMYEYSANEFRYGPAFAVAFSPLTVLPAQLGGLVWLWLNLVAFVWSLRCLAREVLPETWTPNREGLFLLLALVASYRGLWSLQANTLIFAFVVAAMRAILHRQWGRAALWLALPVHIKVWPIAAALLLVACWPRRLAARFTIALLAVAAVPLATKWPSIVFARYHEWYRALTGPMQVRHAYRDMWTLWEVLAPPVDKNSYLILQVCTALLALALCLWQKRRAATTRQLLTVVLGTWVSWQLLFGPGSERATFALIAPLAAWAVVVSFDTARGRVVMVTAFGLMTLASIGQIERAVVDAFPLVLAAHPVGTLLFASWFVVHAGRWRCAAHRSDGLLPAFASAPLGPSSSRRNRIFRSAEPFVRQLASNPPMWIIRLVKNRVRPAKSG